MPCITTNPLFQQLVLDGNVLDIAMRYREDVLVADHARNNKLPSCHLSTVCVMATWTSWPRQQGFCSKLLCAQNKSKVPFTKWDVCRIQTSKTMNTHNFSDILACQ